MFLDPNVFMENIIISPGFSIFILSVVVWLSFAFMYFMIRFSLQMCGHGKCELIAFLAEIKITSSFFFLGSALALFCSSF